MNTEHLFAGVEAIKDAVSRDEPDSDLRTCLAVRDALTDCATELTLARERLDQHIAEVMPEWSVTLPGYGVVKKARKTGKHQLDRATEHLLADIQETRVYDPKTGELIEETPMQKVTACFGLSVHNVREKELERRGLTIKDYAEVINKGWKVDVRKEGK